MSLNGYIATIKREKELQINSNIIEEIVNKNNAHNWFVYIVNDRKNRWEIWKTSFWLSRYLSNNAKIMETGCGIATNLLWFGQRGFHNLYGFDIDGCAISAGEQLFKHMNLPVTLWVDDGLCPKKVPDIKFDAILSFNWTFLLDNFSLEYYLKFYSGFLSKNGIIVIDVIDDSYNNVPKNQYLTSDWDKPEEYRNSSEYKKRYSREEVKKIAASAKMEITKIIKQQSTIPKVVYILRKK